MSEETRESVPYISGGWQTPHIKDCKIKYSIINDKHKQFLERREKQKTYGKRRYNNERSAR